MIDRRVVQRFERLALSPQSIASTQVLAPLFYEQRLVQRISRAGDTFDVYSDVELSTIKDHQGGLTLKIEGIERLSAELYAECCALGLLLRHEGPVSCHLFIACELSPSFGMHTDPDDVVLHVIDGEKFLQTEAETFVLEAGDWLFIPRGTPHRAVNLHGSRMLSFGLERFLVDKL